MAEDRFGHVKVKEVKGFGDISRRSDRYRLTVDGAEVAVRYSDAGHYAIVTTEGMASFEVEVPQGFGGFLIRPMKAGIKASADGNLIRFEAGGRLKLSMEFDGLLTDPLFIFTYPKARSGDRGGASGAPAIVDEGGTLRFAGGHEYDVGPIGLADGETLVIEEGAVVFGQVYAEGRKDVRIMGRGVLDASRMPKDRAARRPKRVMEITDCKGVVIEDITVVDGPTWNVVPLNCEDVYISGINVFSSVGSGDGIDVVGCRRVVIHGCFIKTMDDCIALKATGYDRSQGESDVRDVTADGCVLWNSPWGNAIEIGYETRCGEMRDILFKDIDVIRCEREGYQSGGVLTIHNGDRAFVRDVVYDGIRVEDAREKLIDFKILHSKYSKDAVRGHIDAVTVKNLSVVGGRLPPSIIRGHEEEGHLIGGVTVEGLTYLGSPIEDAIDAKMVVELTRSVRFR
ncbi:MAG: glycosyl hydrolase family 28 protein [Oscillospiraceae bacterium]|nr:glycosyl hydrolase family 28 protein [Oscillospiraceae bacterium]